MPTAENACAKGHRPRYYREVFPGGIGRSRVNCPGCGHERWSGVGPCGYCGAESTDPGASRWLPSPLRGL